MSFDRLTYRADEARRRAEEAYHSLRAAHDEFLERDHRRRVSRPRFETLLERIRETGAPFGAHTAVYRPAAGSVSEPEPESESQSDSRGALLLVRHEGVDMWVLPGGGIDGGESFREAAERELAEEAGVEVAYDGLAYLARVEVVHDRYTTWGVLPVFEARARTTEPEVRDPDGEISEARWFGFDRLPEDTRDREDLLAWRETLSSI